MEFLRKHKCEMNTINLQAIIMKLVRKFSTKYYFIGGKDLFIINYFHMKELNDFVGRSIQASKLTILSSSNASVGADLF